MTHYPLLINFGQQYANLAYPLNRQDERYDTVMIPSLSTVMEESAILLSKMTPAKTTWSVSLGYATALINIRLYCLRIGLMMVWIDLLKITLIWPDHSG